MEDQEIREIRSSVPAEHRVPERRDASLSDPGDSRVASLIKAAKVLAAASTPEEALDQVVRLAVPSYADFCVVVVPGDHQLQMVASAHADPGRDVFARLLRGPVPMSVGGGSPATEAFRRRHPVVVADLDPSTILGWFGDDRYAQFATGIGLQRVIAIPLESRGSTVGVITLGYSDNATDRSAGDLEAARPFADLVAVAVQQLLDVSRRAELVAAFGQRWKYPERGLGSPKTEGSIQIMLIDSLSVVREGVKLLVEQEASMAICAEASSLSAALSQEAEPDVIITGLVFGTDHHPEVVSSLVKRFPDARVLVLSRMAEPIYVHLALNAGAKGYLSKDACPAEVTDAITALARGEEYVQPALGSALARWQRTRDERKSVSSGLTQREHEVLALVSRGHTNAEIASVLGVSLRTVETHRSHLAHKLGVRSRAGLVEAARELDPEI